jgi:hypothetical protein
MRYFNEGSEVNVNGQHIISQASDAMNESAQQSSQDKDGTLEAHEVQKLQVGSRLGVDDQMAAKLPP